MIASFLFFGLYYKFIPQIDDHTFHLGFLKVTVSEITLSAGIYMYMYIINFFKI